jgi:hypothetical protein
LEALLLVGEAVVALVVSVQVRQKAQVRLTKDMTVEITLVLDRLPTALLVAVAVQAV